MVVHFHAVVSVCGVAVFLLIRLAVEYVARFLLPVAVLDEHRYSVALIFALNELLLRAGVRVLSLSVGRCLFGIVIRILRYVVERLKRRLSAFLLQQFYIVGIIDFAERTVLSAEAVIEHKVVVAFVISPHNVEKSGNLIGTRSRRPGKRRKTATSYLCKKRKEIVPLFGKSVVVSAELAVGTRAASLSFDVRRARAERSVRFKVPFLLVEKVGVVNDPRDGQHKRNGVIFLVAIVALFEYVRIALEHGVLDVLSRLFSRNRGKIAVLVKEFVGHNIRNVRKQTLSGECFVVARIEKIKHLFVVLHRTDKVGGVVLGVHLARTQNDAGFALLEMLVGVVRLEILFHFVEVFRTKPRVEHAYVEICFSRVFFLSAASANARDRNRRHKYGYKSFEFLHHLYFCLLIVFDSSAASTARFGQFAFILFKFYHYRVIFSISSLLYFAIFLLSRFALFCALPRVFPRKNNVFCLCCPRKVDKIEDNG